MRIRDQQIDEFSRSRQEAYEDSLASHIREFFPEQFRAAGEADIRETIRYGIGRAAAHGIVTERDVCKYIDLMIVFGRDFDQEHSWAQETLSDQEMPDPADRIDVLCETAKSFEES